MGDGYPRRVGHLGGFRGCADDPEAPGASPSSSIGEVLADATPEAGGSPGTGQLEAVDLSPDDAPPA